MWPPAKKKLQSLNWGRHTHTCTSRVSQPTLPELLPERAKQHFAFICRQGGGTKLLYWHVFSQEITEKTLSGNVLPCLCHRLSHCVQYNIIRSFLRLHVFSNHATCRALFLWMVTWFDLTLKYVWKPLTTTPYIYTYVQPNTCTDLFGSFIRMA